MPVAHYRIPQRRDSKPYRVPQRRPKVAEQNGVKTEICKCLSTVSECLPPVPASDSESLASRVANMGNFELVRRPLPTPNPNLRPIVIDGSNVAVSHGNGNHFSCRGIALCARYFIERGHGDVICFVPNYRKRGSGSPPNSDTDLLIELEEIGVLKTTPSRRIAGRNVVPYDDRFIVELAAFNNGIIVSNDRYRDLAVSDPNWKHIIERQVLQFSFVGDSLIFERKRLGRSGLILHEFLKSPINSSNFLAFRCRIRPKENLRPIIIDGNDVGMSHGNGKKLSCRGIVLCAQYFIERDHKDVVCLGPDNPSDTLNEMSQTSILRTIPKRKVSEGYVWRDEGRHILELAELNGGIIISNADFMYSDPKYNHVLESQVVQYTIVGDLFMFPQDPLGRNGPGLDEMLTADEDLLIYSSEKTV